MAMPGTHLRFAAALADKLGVKDLSNFLSGTLYPDTRWTTGVERERTHDRRYLDPDFPSDDFTLGWHLHCLCDRIQKDLHRQFLDKMSGLSPDEQWIRISAVKVVQDMNDAEKGALDGLLSFLACSRAPLGESCEGIEAFFTSVRRAYGGKKVPEWSDYARLWSEIDLSTEAILQIEKQVNRLFEDQERILDIRSVFDRMIVRWETDNSCR
jgi:hypothetical protein